MSTREQRLSELRPVSAAEYAAFAENRHPDPARIDESTFVLAMPLPSRAYVTSTLTYVFRRDDGVGTVVDPGWGTDENMARLREALDAWAIDRVEAVVCTHLHDDHLGMADRIRDEYGADLVLSRQEWRTLQADPFGAGFDDSMDAWGVPEDRRIRSQPGASALRLASAPDRLVDDGEEIDVGRPLRVIMTPGHTQGGIALVDEQKRRILTGDHVMPHLNPGLGLGYVGDGDPIADYYESTERLLAWDGFEVLPGHGYRFAALGRRARTHVSHHLRRSREVARVLDEDPSASVWRVASQLSWTAGWDALEGYFLFSALSQTAMHMRFVGDADRAARWLAHPEF
jgi:glyoxylase-like metal-dependent hydrolase (beta-lactamase superfamily II)